MPKIDGQTRLLGLVGKNANYTLSPLIHTSSARELDINQIYVNFDLDQIQIESFLNSFWHIGGVGLNVTKPYKETVARLVPDSKLSSVNTLCRNIHESWSGFSTDGEGFVQGLKHDEIEISSIDHLIVLGSGGAVKGLLDYILPRYKQIKSVDLFTRNSKAGIELVRLSDLHNTAMTLHEWNTRSLTDATSKYSGPYMVSAPHIP